MNENIILATDCGFTNMKATLFDAQLHFIVRGSIPSLTTIRINKNQLGRESVRTLVEMFRGENDLLNIKKIGKAKLLVRESS